MQYNPQTPPQRALVTGQDRQRGPGHTKGVVSGWLLPVLIGFT